MKIRVMLLTMFLGYSLFSQVNIDQLLESGIEDARRFSKDYFNPMAEAAINSMSNGWYSTAKTKKLFDYEVGLIGNLSFTRDEKRSFILNELNYDNLTFRDNSSVQLVANAFGENAEDIVMIVDDGSGRQFEIVLPDGLNGTGIKRFPRVFVQGSMGLVKSTELKLRFAPKLSAGDNAKIGLWGIGFQNELTDWVYSWKRWPFRFSGIVAYTNVRATYDFSDDSGIESDDQELKFRANSWLLSGIVSTKMEKFNFYGGFGYFSGKATTDLKGEYTIVRGPNAGEILNDPYDVENKESGLKATLGARYELGVFKANLDYSFQNYQTISVGLHVGW